jgi:quinol-cytochrome oxidoreductase complex cytochrome b subunit
VARPPTRLRRFLDWIDERVGFREFLQRLTPGRLIYDPIDRRLDMRRSLVQIFHRELPANFSCGHYLGVIIFFLFCIQVVTGILLAFNYKPSTEMAYASVQHILNGVPLGYLIREIHAWASEFMIIAVFLHVGHVFFKGSYGKPRELTWLTGSFLLILTLAFGFTGFLLPWSQKAYWATRVGTEVIGWLPLLGPTLLTFLRGGSDVSGETLTRFYALHILVLPWIITAVIVVHFALVKRLGLQKIGD